MRMPRFRLKVWWLMVAVAGVGLLISGDIMRRRRNYRLARVAYWAAMEADSLNQAAMADAMMAEMRAERRSRGPGISHGLPSGDDDRRRAQRRAVQPLRA